MGQGEIAFSDLTHRRRLMTLRSLDERVAKLVATVVAANRNSTSWFFFTADNVFHLGQFTMPDGKRRKKKKKKTTSACRTSLTSVCR